MRLVQQDISPSSLVLLVLLSCALSCPGEGQQLEHPLACTIHLPACLVPARPHSAQRSVVLAAGGAPSLAAGPSPPNDTTASGLAVAAAGGSVAATRGLFPYVTALYSQQAGSSALTFRCTGTLIHKRLVAAPAHCFRNVFNSWESWVELSNATGKVSVEPALRSHGRRRSPPHSSCTAAALCQPCRWGVYRWWAWWQSLGW